MLPVARPLPVLTSSACASASAVASPTDARRGRAETPTRSLSSLSSPPGLPNLSSRLASLRLMDMPRVPSAASCVASRTLAPAGAPSSLPVASRSVTRPLLAAMPAARGDRPDTRAPSARTAAPESKRVAAAATDDMAAVPSAKRARLHTPQSVALAKRLARPAEWDPEDGAEQGISTVRDAGAPVVRIGSLAPERSEDDGEGPVEAGTQRSDVEAGAGLAVHAEHGQYIRVAAREGICALAAEQDAGMMVATAADNVQGVFSAGFACCVAVVCRADGCVGLEHTSDASAANLRRAIDDFSTDQEVNGRPFTTRLGYTEEGFRSLLRCEVEHMGFAPFCEYYGQRASADSAQARAAVIERIIAKNTAAARAGAAAVGIEAFEMSSSAIFVSLAGEIDTFDDLPSEDVDDLGYESL
ncbi:hypothetical protein WG922_08485 [Ramlibacter sp. AN1015]|uniref:hypothetical protein n=1 Tax=Ramlibacter sp. AN1015 TaxID=3133428 RepID=UPI0030C15CEA